MKLAKKHRLHRAGSVWIAAACGVLATTSQAQTQPQPPAQEQPPVQNVQPLPPVSQVPQVQPLQGPTASDSAASSAAAEPAAAAAPPRPRSVNFNVLAQATWTSNAGLAPTGQEQEDFITEIAPSLQLMTRGKRARLNGEIGFSAINYVNGTGRDEVLPRVRLLGNLEAIERLFFIDAGITTTQIAEDPLLGRVEGSNTTNVMTTTNYMVAPYLDWRLSPRTRIRARSDQSRIETQGDSGVTRVGAVQDGRFSRNEASFETDPKPVGFAVNTQRTQTKFEGQAQDSLSQNISRAILSWAPNDEWTFSARAGREDTEAHGVILADDSLHGGSIEWRPTQRTLLRGMREDRFFGSGWEGVFSHRMPWFAVNFRAASELSSFPQELLTLASGGNVAQMLDAMLTTRFPDATERARQVQELMRSQGLPATLGGPLTLYTQEAFVSTSRSLTLGWVGPHSTLTLSGGTLRVEPIPTSTGAPPSPITALSIENSAQRVFGLNFTYRLGRTQTLGLILGHTFIETLGTTTPGLVGTQQDETRQRSMRLTLTQNVSPRTEIIFGVRRRLSDSRLAADFTENAVFAALSTHLR